MKNAHSLAALSFLFFVSSAQAKNSGAATSHSGANRGTTATSAATGLTTGDGTSQSAIAVGAGGQTVTGGGARASGASASGSSGGGAGSTSGGGGGSGSPPSASSRGEESEPTVKCGNKDCPSGYVPGPTGTPVPGHLVAKADMEDKIRLLRLNRRRLVTAKADHTTTANAAASEGYTWRNYDAVEDFFKGFHDRVISQIGDIDVTLGKIDHALGCIDDNLLDEGYYSVPSTCADESALEGAIIAARKAIDDNIDYLNGSLTELSQPLTTVRVGTQNCTTLIVGCRQRLVGTDFPLIVNYENLARTHWDETT